jgi:hypothetical protein
VKGPINGRFLMHLLDCTYGSLVALLAWSIVGGGFLYVACIVLVPVGAIIRYRNHVQTEEAIEHYFGIKTTPIIKDRRRITTAVDQTSVMVQHYTWIFSKRGLLSLVIVGAVLFGLFFCLR